MSNFRLDAHIHCPIERLDGALSIAIKRGINGVIFTEYGNTLPFDSLQDNRYNGNVVLPWNYWNVAKTSDPRVLKIYHSRDGVEGNIYVGKGQEVQSSEGDVLAWGIDQTIKPGKKIEETIKEILNQEAIAVLAHPCAALFGGCGAKHFSYLAAKFKGKAIATEMNAQYPCFNAGWLDFNAQTEELARILEIVLFYNSDIHGKYLEEHLKLGKKLHNVIYEINGEDMFTKLRSITRNNLQNLVKPAGEFNTLAESAKWWREGGIKKIGKATRGILRGLIR